MTLRSNFWKRGKDEESLDEKESVDEHVA